MIGQFFALDGMLGSRSRAHVHVGHVTFTLAVWLGAFCTTGPELTLVAALAAVAWGSRRALGHCMFSRARESTNTDDPRYDLLYALPLLVALRRMQPCNRPLQHC